MISLTELQGTFKGKISLNEILAKYTTFRIGGEADYYAEPVDAQDLLNLIVYLRKREFPFYIMGNGSNVLISDMGIRGVVVNLESGFSYLRHEKRVHSCRSRCKAGEVRRFLYTEQLCRCGDAGGDSCDFGWCFDNECGCL